MHICTVTVAIVHKCTILRNLMCCFFGPKCVKDVTFFYFAKFYTTWCSCSYYSTCINILIIFFSICLCCSHLTLPLASLSVINITPLPHEELHHSTSHHCRWSASNHTPLDQIAADHSPLNLHFSHLIKIKPLSPMNSLIKIKPLLSIIIKPLPHKA